jgi:transcriptional regulator with XRE-family HTH domain
MTQAPSKTASGILSDTGRALFISEDWQRHLADALGVRRDTVRQWITGRMRFPPDHPALVRLQEITDRRAEEICRASDELRDYLQAHREGEAG